MRSRAGGKDPSRAWTTVWVALVATAAPAVAQPVVELPSEGQVEIRAPHLEVLEDPDRRWSLEDVRSPALASRFQPPELAWPEAPAGSAVWVRFRPARRDGTPRYLRIGYSALEKVCVHWPLEAGGGDPTCTGMAFPFSTRPVPNHHFLFPVPADLHDGAPVHVYAESSFPMRLPLSMLTAESLYLQTRAGHLAKGIYYGFMAAMVLYNFFLFVGTREPTYVFYSLHIGTFTIAFAGFEGLGDEYLWPAAPWLRAAPLFLLGAAFVFGVVFVRKFLLTRAHLPAVDRVLLGVAALGAAGMLATFADWQLANWLDGLAALLFTAGVTVAAIFRLRAGYRPAGFLLAALAVYLLTAPLATLTSLEIIPWTGAEMNLVRIGVALGALLQAFGLAYRVRELAAERERLIPELETRTAEMERFTYTVSHDLKTPLISISGFLGILQKDVEAGDSRAVREDIGRIGAASRRMARLLDELLEFSRAGKVFDSFQRVDLGEIVRQTLELLQDRLAERGVAVEVAPDLPAVEGDPKRLQEVFQNLLDNSLQFLGDQPEPRIEISCRLSSQEATVRIRDNGIGIDPRYHEKIFELFERLDAFSEGTGVGLALAKRIVESHGGRIWVESQGLGKGSTFCLALPSGKVRPEGR